MPTGLNNKKNLTNEIAKLYKKQNKNLKNSKLGSNNKKNYNKLQQKQKFAN
jgi:hypothetical protein